MKRCTFDRRIKLYLQTLFFYSLISKDHRLIENLIYIFVKFSNVHFKQYEIPAKV